MSSRITNVVATQFTAAGGQAIVSQLRNMGAQTGMFFNRLNDTSRMSERLNNQWRAIGTTIRYAIAGGAVFGLTNMVGQLKTMQTQLGLISAIGQTPGGKPIVGQQLTTMFNDILKGATESLTPVQDYTSAVVNLLSTVGEVPQNKIAPIVTEISRAAQLSQISAEDATKAFTTMNVAFGRPTNLKSIHDMAQEFYLLTRYAPGGPAAGAQIIGQLGQLAPTARLAQARPQDMFALLLSSLRGGIPPSQAGRGLQFLLQTIGLPGSQTKVSQEALASVGITPRANLTAQQRLAKIFGRARQLGISGNVRPSMNLDEDALSQMEALSPGQAVAGLGAHGAGAEFLGKIFRRIHALRTALAISQQIDVGQGQKDLKLMDDGIKGHLQAIDTLANGWKKLADNAQLQQASIDIEALNLQIARNVIGPPASLITRHVIHPVTQAALHHPEAARDFELALAGSAGVIGLGRLFGAGRLLPKIPGLRSLPGIGSISRLLGASPGTAFVRGNAIQAAISGAQGLGSTPQNPMYVTVVGQLFGGGTPSPTPPIGTPPVVPKGGPLATIRKYAPLAIPVGGRSAAVATRVAPPLMAILAALAVTKGAMDPNTIEEQKKQMGNSFWSRMKFASNPWNVFKGIGAGIADDQGLLEMLGVIGGGRDRGRAPSANAIALKRAQEIWNKNGNVVTGIRDAGISEGVNAKGVHEIAMTITVKHPDGTTQQRKVHIPVNLWEKKPAPTNKVKAPTRR